MLVWLKRLKPNHSTLPAALLATAFCGVSLLLIWTAPTSSQSEMTRYGKALTQTLADSNAGLMLRAEHIQLAVIANMVHRYPEVSGVIFYSPNQNIIAVSGNTQTPLKFTAAATLDDTISGYVSIFLAAETFAKPTPVGRWLLTLATLLFSPFLSLGILQISSRGNRSLPIVSVPDPIATKPQPSFALTLNLHNQMALPLELRTSAIEDAMTMALEVCAIYDGMAVALQEKGIMVLLDMRSVSAEQAIYAAFLLQRLLTDFETHGEFRCYLNTLQCPGSPAELALLSVDSLEQTADINSLLTLATLAKAPVVLIDELIYTQIEEATKTWATEFQHPLLEDLGAVRPIYAIHNLPAEQADTVSSQAKLILGFNTP